MSGLSLEQLCQEAKQAIKVLTPEVEPGAFVWVLDPTGNQRDQAEELWQEVKQEGSGVGFRRFLVTFCLVNDQNEQLVDTGDSVAFTATMLELDYSLPMAVLQRIFNAAYEAMGMSREDLTELEGNLEQAS